MGNFSVTLRQPGGNTSHTIYTLYEVGSGDNDYLISPTLKLEINKAGTFEFDILPSHTYYSVLRRYIHYICVKEDDDILFYGRILSMSLTFNGLKHVTCEGLMANLLDCPMYNPLAQTEAQLFTIGGNQDVYGMFATAIKAYRNRVRTDIQLGSVWASTTLNYGMDEIDLSGGTSVGDFISSELVEAIGGYLEMEYVEELGGGEIWGLLHWREDPEIKKSKAGYANETIEQTISFGENMLDMSAESTEDDIFTGIVPMWEDANGEKKWTTLREVDVDGGESISNNPVYIYRPYVIGASGGLGAVGIKVVDMPGAKTYEKAVKYASNYVNKYCSSYLLDSGVNIDFDSFTVRALDIHFLGDDDTEKIWLHDRVKVKCAPHSINRILMCSSLEISIDNPLNSSYTFSLYRPKASSNDKVLTRQIKKKGLRNT